jgi:hypothetical protein
MGPDWYGESQKTLIFFMSRTDGRTHSLRQTSGFANKYRNVLTSNQWRSGWMAEIPLVTAICRTIDPFAKRLFVPFVWFHQPNADVPMADRHHSDSLKEQIKNI